MARGNLISTGGESTFARTGAKEKIDYIFYDTASCVSATAATKAYFQSVATDYTQGNFEGTGAMPAGQGFHVRTLRIITNPLVATFADVQNIMRFTWVTFTIEGSKKYAFAPGWAFPSGVGVNTQLLTGAAAPAAPANGVSYGNHGLPTLGNVFMFRRPIQLRPLQPFKVTLDLSASITLSATQNISIAMDGDLERNII